MMQWLVKVKNPMENRVINAFEDKVFLRGWNCNNPI